jgi:diaminohydroxyphosphoribosylaminopyrimidine deaminase/5-amino-6-(5-phosphoribosylamino)uracil reductase
MSSDPGPMRAGLALARRGLGSTWPNPSVGCVIVKGGAVIARGSTQKGGRPHAEAVALERAGKAAKGATVYVTLEPCCHHGKTPPCTEALISSGVSRVVVASQDPDPRVSGQGIARLRAAGIAVELGLCGPEAEEVNTGFFSLMRRGIPMVSLKIASSLDGRVAVASRESRWITGEPARDRVHLLRAIHDAVMVGSGTVLADDPELTCRLPGMAGRSPVRIVADGALRVPLTARVVATAREVPSWFLVRPGMSGERRSAFKGCGVEIVEVPAAPTGETDLTAALQELGKRGITRILVEGGATIATALLRADLVDRLCWFRAPSVIGGDGLPALTALGLEAPAQAPRFKRLALETVGEDVLETLGRAA